MSASILLFASEAACDAALAAIDAYLGLPNEAAQRWAEKRQAPNRDIWWFDAGDYPRMEAGHWVRRDVETSGLAMGGGATALPDNANIAAVLAAVGGGGAVRLRRARARALGIESVGDVGAEREAGERGK